MSITNFLGISGVAFDVSSDGAIIEGGNARGKTTIIKAVIACLTGRGISAGAIHKGATSSEILLNMGHITVRRMISGDGKSRVVVKRFPSGDTVASPQAYLSALLGLAPLDPITFFTEDDAKEQKKLLLAAMPAPVTPAQLQTWVPLTDIPWAALLGLTPEQMAAFVAEPDVALPGHGLEIVSSLTALVYERRKEANAVVKRLAFAYEQATTAETAAVNVLVVAAGGMTPTLSLEDAQAAISTLLAQEKAMEAATRQAAKQATAQERTRARVVELRAQATKMREEAPLAPKPEAFEEVATKIRDAHEEVTTAESAVLALEVELKKAQIELTAKKTACETLLREREALDKREADARAAVEKADEISQTAAGLEEALGAAPAGPTQEEREAFGQAFAKATRDEELAKLARDRSAAEAVAKRANDELTSAKSIAGHLDTIVDRLKNEAPAELLRNGGGGIEGLTIVGDEILFEGRPLSGLSGAERLFFALDVVRHLNSGSRLILVDGVEALDADRLPEFISRATAGGYQLIATRVTAGDAVVRPIVGETEDAEAGAEPEAGG